MNITLSHPKKCALKVPLGRILVNKRWGGSTVSKELETSDCRVTFSDGLGFVDFLPSDSFAVLYITEAELLTPKSYTERVKLLANDYNHRGAIFVDLCRSSGYQDLQDLATIEHEISVYPIANQSEIPRILQALMHAETRQSGNPFKMSLPVEGDMAKQQIALLRQIPSIGEKTAVKLLKSYGHITAISKISEERLAFKIGKADAEKVSKYLKHRVTL